MSIGNKWKYGDKKSNFNFQLRFLREIAECCGLIPPPPPPPSVFYTATLALSGPDGQIDPGTDAYLGNLTINGIVVPPTPPGFFPVNDCSAQNQWYLDALTGGLANCPLPAYSYGNMYLGEQYTDCFSPGFYIFTITRTEPFDVYFYMNLLDVSREIRLISNTPVTSNQYCATTILPPGDIIITYTLEVPMFNGGFTNVTFYSVSNPVVDDAVTIKAELMTIMDRCQILGTVPVVPYIDVTVNEPFPGTYEHTVKLPDTHAMVRMRTASGGSIVFAPC